MEPTTFDTTNAPSDTTATSSIEKPSTKLKHGLIMEELKFKLIKNNGRYNAICLICNRTMANSSISRLHGHRNRCNDNPDDENNFFNDGDEEENEDSFDSENIFIKCEPNGTQFMDEFTSEDMKESIYEPQMSLNEESTGFDDDNDDDDMEDSSVRDSGTVNSDDIEGTNKSKSHRWTEPQVEALLKAILKTKIAKKNNAMNNKRCKLFYRHCFKQPELKKTGIPQLGIEIVKHKVRYLKKKYMQAKQFHKDNNIIDTWRDFEDKKRYTLNICPFIDYLDQIYSNDPKVISAISGEPYTEEKKTGEIAPKYLEKIKIPSKQKQNESDDEQNPLFINKNLNKKQKNNLFKDLEDQLETSEKSNQNKTKSKETDEELFHFLIENDGKSRDKNKKLMERVEKKRKHSSSEQSDSSEQQPDKKSSKNQVPINIQKSEKMLEYELEKEKLKIEQDKLKYEFELKKHEIDQQTKLKQMEIEKDERLQRYELELKYNRH